METKHESRTVSYKNIHPIYDDQFGKKSSPLGEPESIAASQGEFDAKLPTAAELEERLAVFDDAVKLHCAPVPVRVTFDHANNVSFWPADTHRIEIMSTTADVRLKVAWNGYLGLSIGQFNYFIHFEKSKTEG